MGQSALIQSDCMIFKSTISAEQINETAWFMNLNTNSQKLEVVQKIFGWAWSKYACCESGSWTLKLNVSQEQTDEINWFFACCYKFMQIKKWLKIFGVCIAKNWCSQSESGGKNLKLLVAGEPTDGINWLFACWYRLLKIKKLKKFFG